MNPRTRTRTRSGLILSVLGFLVWCWIVSEIPLHSPRQYIAAALLLFLFTAPGIHTAVVPDGQNWPIDGERKRKRRGKRQNEIMD